MKIIWNVSNLLSLSRIFLSVPLYYSFSFPNRTFLISMLLLASATDILDGYIARKKNQITDFGKLLDPLSDKVFVTVFVLGLLIYNIIPVWFFIVIVSRDLLILLGGLIMIKKSKNIPYSDKFGKATVTVLGLTLMMVILEVLPKEQINYLLYSNLIMVAVSLLNYSRKFLLTLKTK